jgi:hypothetical protein
MAKKKTNWWLWGGLALGLGYMWYTQQKPAVPASAPLAPPLLPPPLPVPVTAIPAGTAPSLPIAPTIVQAPVSPVAAVAPSLAVQASSSSPVQANPPSLAAAGPIGPGEITAAGVPYDPRMLTLQDWANATMKVCDLSRWNLNQTNFTAAEWNGLFDLYFNDWVGGQGNNAARTAFWNAWRSKYSILTNTPC